jgi:L-amino acid N-acyltransferase YncA
LTDLVIRQATADDAAGVAGVLNGVIAEREHTILDGPFSIEAERSFLASLPARSAVFVAERDGAVIGVQSLDLFSTVSTAMSHVATLGTWIGRGERGRGVGTRLADASFAFARAHAYRKILIQVLADNTSALAFYRRLGFADIGVARAHAMLNDSLYDEIYLELHL